nr:hypothetical protein CFP56_02157 [Quercus suber]
MAVIAAEIPDEFSPGPMEGSVLRFLKEYRSCAVSEGEVASHKQMLKRYVVGSPEYKQIIAILKAVECLHRILPNFPWKRPMGQIQKRQKILDDQA